MQSVDAQEPFVWQVFASHNVAVTFMELWSETKYSPLAKVSYFL